MLVFGYVAAATDVSINSAAANTTVAVTAAALTELLDAGDDELWQRSRRVTHHLSILAL